MLKANDVTLRNIVSASDLILSKSNFVSKTKEYNDFKLSFILLV